MQGLRGEAGPFDLSRRRRATSNPDRLVRLFLYRGPILLVAGVHTFPKHARVYLRSQAVVVRPRFYPIRRTLRPFHLPINRNLHCSDQLTHASLRSFVVSLFPGGVILLGRSPRAPPSQRLSYSSWRRNQGPVSLRPLGARSSQWYASKNGS